MMKSTFGKLTVLTTALVGCLVVGHQAQALPIIHGSVSFGGSPNVNETTPGDLSTATAITGFKSPGVFVNPSEQFGDYSAIPNFFTPVTFANLTFNPPTVSTAVPLWTLTYGGTTYSFDATTMVSSYDSATRQWNIGGNGIAKITGFQDTPGIWNVHIGVSGSSFSFGSTAAVPDGGVSVALLGFALVGVEGLRRKLAR